ncbi:hypothetical protein BC936DRAFT_141013 [Jimgerdemannia flammicorona]|uniref:Uncharacterized protein n=1 Tax=Jimgerdemannia flammicorona TaxID=994334 RepID=A0A433DMS3_9FUNG|nr:hypothetical protein BC936DRAFT_141013 [Jimgerdemannia flammicorona]
MALATLQQHSPAIMSHMYIPEVLARSNPTGAQPASPKCHKMKPRLVSLGLLAHVDVDEACTETVVRTQHELIRRRRTSDPCKDPRKRQKCKHWMAGLQDPPIANWVPEYWQQDNLVANILNFVYTPPAPAIATDESQITQLSELIASQQNVEWDTTTHRSLNQPSEPFHVDPHVQYLANGSPFPFSFNDTELEFLQTILKRDQDTLWASYPYVQ